jgi:hypothetical protein
VTKKNTSNSTKTEIEKSFGQNFLLSLAHCVCTVLVSSLFKFFARFIFLGFEPHFLFPFWAQNSYLDHSCIGFGFTWEEELVFLVYRDTTLLVFWGLEFSLITPFEFPAPYTLICLWKKLRQWKFNKLIYWWAWIGPTQTFSATNHGLILRIQCGMWILYF